MNNRNRLTTDHHLCTHACRRTKEIDNSRCEVVGCGINNRTPDLDGNAFSPLDSWYTYRAEVFERMYSVGPG